MRSNYDVSTLWKHHFKCSSQIPTVPNGRIGTCVGSKIAMAEPFMYSCLSFVFDRGVLKKKKTPLTALLGAARGRAMHGAR